MKKSIIISNIIFISLSLIFDAMLIITNIYPFKVLASACFMVASAINYIQICRYMPEKKKTASILTTGVFFAMTADIIINLNFIFGTGLFMLVHILYLIAYSMMRSFSRDDIFISAAVLMLSAFCVFSPDVDFGSALLSFVCVIYAGVLSVMTGKAVTNCIRLKGMFYLVIAVGSILFYFSDIMLLMDRFSDIDFPFSAICRALYYPGQCLIASSFIHAKASETE